VVAMSGARRQHFGAYVRPAKKKKKEAGPLRFLKFQKKMPDTFVHKKANSVQSSKQKVEVRVFID
jgi:hypothetical protein